MLWAAVHWIKLLSLLCAMMRHLVLTYITFLAAALEETCLHLHVNLANFGARAAFNNTKLCFKEAEGGKQCGDA